MKRGWFRRTILWIHLALGLSASLVLIVIALTGAVLAFSNDYVRWLNRDFFSVNPAGEPMSLDAIVATVETEYKPSRVDSINYTFAGNYAYLFMNNRALIVNTIDGRILDPRAGESWNSQLVIKANDIHKKLAMGKIGQFIRDIATYEALVLIPTGVLLWCRTKRFSIKWNSSWYRRLWDFHNTIGVIIALPIFFLALTGTLIALRLPESFRADAPPKSRLPEPRSALPADAAQRVSAPIDAAIAVANAEMPGLRLYQVNLPESSTSSIAVNKSPEGWGTRNQRTSVFVDRYSGKVLRVDSPRQFTPMYKQYDWGKRLHGGEPLGFFGKAVFFISALLFALLAVSGIALGVSKMYRFARRSRIAASYGTPPTDNAVKPAAKI